MDLVALVYRAQDRTLVHGLAGRLGTAVPKRSRYRRSPTFRQD